MPRYQHDCNHCIPLGEFNEFDLYFCKQNGLRDTVVARWEDDGPQYMSGLATSQSIPQLAEAHKRAVARGLLK